MAEHSSIRRALRQHLRATQLLGLDFVPIGATAVAPDDAADVGSTPGLIDISMVGADSKQKQVALDRLREIHDAECPHCTTAKGHTRTVFGEGDPDALLMFIGEAPGADEDRTGRPFVGRAGQKLNEIITAMGLQRENVYIANILKARPPDNRTPQPDEVARCSPFLVEQIRIIRPKVIVALGGPSAKFLLNTNIGITRLRGTFGAFRLSEDGSEVPVMPTFHPAYLLRAYTKENRAKVWSDMKLVLDRLGA